MNKRIAFKHVDRTPALEDFINKRLEKIEHLLESERSPVSIDIVIEGYPNHAHNRVEVIVKTADFHLIAHHEGADVNKEIDVVLEKMLDQIRTAKDKLQDKQRAGAGTIRK